MPISLVSSKSFILILWKHLIPLFKWESYTDGFWGDPMVSDWEDFLQLAVLARANLRPNPDCACRQVLSTFCVLPQCGNSQFHPTSCSFGSTDSRHLPHSQFQLTPKRSLTWSNAPPTPKSFQTSLSPKSRYHGDLLSSPFLLNN
jgi:hypothetical protein